MTVKERCRKDSCTNTPDQSVQTGSSYVNTAKKSLPSAPQRQECFTFISNITFALGKGSRCSVKKAIDHELKRAFFVSTYNWN